MEYSCLFCIVQCRCKSCGLNAVQCNGHCGHIELVNPSYNPLLVNKLTSILNKTCFYCYHFRAKKEEVSWSSLLLLIVCLVVMVCCLALANLCVYSGRNLCFSTGKNTRG